MTSANRVILTGRVASPPRRHYRPDGVPVIQFPLELNGSKNLSGQAVHRHGTGQAARGMIDIVAFGKLAEFELDLLRSGQHLLVKGRLNQRCWQTPEGRNRTRTEVIATDLRIVEERNQPPARPPRDKQATGKMDLSERGEEDEETC